MFSRQHISGVIIASGGQFGRYLAEMVSLADELVTIIDIGPDCAQKLSSDFAGTTVEGDASNIETLKYSGINHARAIVAATDDDNINLMISQIAKDIYNVPVIIAVVADTAKIPLIGGFEFTILCPAQIMSKIVIDELKKKEG